MTWMKEKWWNWTKTGSSGRKWQENLSSKQLRQSWCFPYVAWSPALHNSLTHFFSSFTHNTHEIRRILSQKVGEYNAEEMRGISNESYKLSERKNDTGREQCGSCLSSSGCPMTVFTILSLQAASLAWRLEDQARPTTVHLTLLSDIYFSDIFGNIGENIAMRMSKVIPL